MTNRQPPRSRPADHWSEYETHWRSHAILSDTVLELLYRLNLEYLEFLARSPQQRAVRGPGAALPEAIFATIAALTPQRREQIARCPFSLFGARFFDHAFWSRVTSAAVVADKGAEASLYLSRDRGETFVYAGLLFAWHVVHMNAVAAPLVLGMSPRTVQVFTAVSLLRVLDIAYANQEVIRPRWAERVDFWQELLAEEDAASARGPNGAHMLGLQLLAAEIAMDGGRG